MDILRVKYLCLACEKCVFLVARPARTQLHTLYTHHTTFRRPYPHKNPKMRPKETFLVLA